MQALKGTLAGAAMAIVLGGCVGAQAPELTPLEKTGLQTRSYDRGKDAVFRSVISVLQTQGFAVTEADLETGLIGAISTTEAKTNVWAAVLGVHSEKARQVQATAFVEVLQSRTHVRVGFVATTKQFGNYGQSGERGEQIWDAQVYQDFFEALETAIFMRS